MKILITNIVTLNAGDAAILHAMIKILRAAFGKDTQFVVYDKHGDILTRYYPDLVFRKLLYLSRGSNPTHWSTSAGLRGRMEAIRFRLGLWAVRHGIPAVPQLLLNDTELRDLLEYKTADLIISSGGTYLVENYSMAARVFDYQVSLYLQRPLVFFTQSLGPFSDPSNRKALRPIFDNSLAILVRDKQSARNLLDLGVKNGHVHLAADAAFALSEHETLEAAKVHVDKPYKLLRVAISVREWAHFKMIEPALGMKQYKDALRALSEYLVVKHNAEVTYLSTCQGVPEYWTDDSKMAQSIVDALPSNARNSVSVDSSFRDPLVLAQKLKEYDLVIATRMHMAILALGVGTPVIPIAYEFKIHELFERLGQKQWVQDIETISGNSLINRVDGFLRALPEVRETLFSAVQREFESAAASGHVVKEAFEEWRKPRNK